MVDIWEFGDVEPVGLDEAVSYFEELGPRLFEDEFDVTARMVRRLGANREFVVSHVRDMLSASGADLPENRYTAQAFIIHVGRTFTVRVPVWEEASGVAGSQIFAYGVPHDHDFSFFTTGYHGPGYETDLFRYEYSGALGFPGEPVSLTACGRERLDSGKVMLFRRSSDVHVQWPPRAFSMSLNVMENPPGMGTRRRQYLFDLGRQTIVRRLNEGALDTLVRLGAVAGGHCATLVESIARSDPAETLRRTALDALCESVDESFAAVAAADPAPHVRRAWGTPPCTAAVGPGD